MSFKIYADFESVVVVIEIIIPHTLKTIKNTVFAVLPIKSFIKPVVLYGGINAINRLIEAIYKECDFCKKVIKKDFNKNFVMSAEDEERFQSSNKCWVCDKLCDVGDNKVRGHCHVIGKYIDSAHCSCNIDLKLTGKIPVIFPSLRGYSSHLIVREIGKWDVKVSVIANELQKCMVFAVNKGLAFIDNMQFMNSSLDALLKNLSDNDFKYSSQEFSSDLLKLLREKEVYPYEYMENFEKYFDGKLPDRCNFFFWRLVY